MSDLSLSETFIINTLHDVNSQGKSKVWYVVIEDSRLLIKAVLMVLTSGAWVLEYSKISVFASFSS